MCLTVGDPWGISGGKPWGKSSPPPSPCMMMMMFNCINYKERVSKNQHCKRFHTDQPKRHKYKKISMIIRYKGSINNKEAETKRLTSPIIEIIE
jgi:hypothetical protein